MASWYKILATYTYERGRAVSVRSSTVVERINGSGTTQHMPDRIGPEMPWQNLVQNFQIMAQEQAYTPNRTEPGTSSSTRQYSNNSTAPIM